MANPSDPDLRKRRLKPRKTVESQSKKARVTKGVTPDAPVKPESSRPKRQRPATTSLATPNNRTKPVSRVRLKALRQPPSRAEKSTPPKPQGSKIPNVDTIASSPSVPVAPSQRVRPSKISAPPSREATRPEPEMMPSFSDPEEHDATIMNLSSDLVAQARTSTASDELILGKSSLPEYSDPVESHDKTVVGFAIGDGFADLAGNRFDEPVITSRQATEEREESYNDEKTMFGVALNLESRTVTPPPPPPSEKLKKSKELAIPVGVTDQGVLSSKTEDSSPGRVSEPPALPPVAPQRQANKRPPSSGLRTIPLSKVAPEKVTPPELQAPAAPSKSSASSIRGVSVDRASLINLDPIMPASSSSLSPPSSESSQSLSASNISLSSAGRSTPIYAAKHPRPPRRADHGWAKGIILNIIPGGLQFATGRPVEGARELLLGCGVILPALLILITWSSQVNRMSALSIPESWMIAHAILCVLSITMYEAIRVVASNQHEELEFALPRWVSAFFLPSLFLLYITPRLIELAPAILGPIWYGALVLGGISCMTSWWCIFYDVRKTGPKDSRFWGAMLINSSLFMLLLVTSGVINLRILF